MARHPSPARTLVWPSPAHGWRVVAAASLALLVVALLFGASPDASARPGSSGGGRAGPAASAADESRPHRKGRPGRGRSRSRQRDRATPAPQPVAQVSYLEIARRAIVAGDLERAAKALSEARTCWQQHGTACGFVRVDYQALVGVVYLEHGVYAKAAQALGEVTRTEPQRKAAWLYLGQALFHLERYPEARRALYEAAEVGQKLPGYYALLARTELAVDQPKAARRTLLRGLHRYPQERALLREIAQLYVRYGMYQTAAELSRSYLSAASGETFAHLLVADALRGAGRAPEALALLEEAHLRAPDDDQVLAHLAYTYAEAACPYAAARLFEQLAANQPRYAYEAAEQYRSLGRHRQALKLSWLVPDQGRRLRQQLSIFLGAESYDRAVGLLGRLGRAGAMDDPVRYRLAYAAIRTRQLDLAEKLLFAITATTQAAGATRLQEVVAACRERPWDCP